MSFDDTLIDTAPMFLDTFGEPALYTPKNGAPREILVIVDRRPPEMFRASDGKPITPKMIIQASNDEIGGIDAATFDRFGSDTLSLPELPGRDNITLRIYQPDPEFGAYIDAGFVALFLR